eukprot:11126596-Lingulodinium_polyedra.AAC.1
MVASAGWNLASPLSLNRSQRLHWRSFPRGPPRGGAGSVDDPTGRPATPIENHRTAGSPSP